jgi:2-amino-4-hydroxy-6-hydroxymethyldihydropteridine diphosphokinase
VDALTDLPDTRVTAISHAYESEPAYVTGQPLFANAAAAIETDLESGPLLGYLQQIEESMGRVRAAENGPRPIDLDILLFGDEESQTADLTIPHPRMLERDFVVTPLLEIAPRVHLPDGTHVTRDSATVGPVIGDLGAIPDVGALHNDPVLPGEWVDVADGSRDQDVVAGWDPQLMLIREILEQAEIPFRWDPYEPEATTDPFGLPMQFRILVPEGERAHALELIAAVMAAEPQFPPDQIDES